MAKTVQELLNALNRLVLEDPATLDAEVELEVRGGYGELCFVMKHIGEHPDFGNKTRTTLFLHSDDFTFATDG